MDKPEMIKAIATMPIKVDGERVPAGKPFIISKEECDAMPYASEYTDKDEAENSMTEEERNELIATAVKEAAAAKPERKTQPLVSDVEAISGFNVTGAEVKVAFEALNEK